MSAMPVVDDLDLPVFEREPGLMSNISTSGWPRCGAGWLARLATGLRGAGPGVRRVLPAGPADRVPGPGDRRDLRRHWRPAARLDRRQRPQPDRRPAPAGCGPWSAQRLAAGRDGEQPFVRASSASCGRPSAARRNRSSYQAVATAYPSLTIAAVLARPRPTHRGWPMVRLGAAAVRHPVRWPPRRRGSTGR